MTTFLEEIRDAPDIEPEVIPTRADDLFGAPEVDDEPVRTRQRKPRERKIDPVTGEEIKRPYVRQSAKLGDDLVESLVSVASDISAVAPTVAGVLIARAETAVDGMMALAKGKPRTTAALRKVASVSKIAELLSVVGLVIVAAMVDFGKIPVDSPILDRVGFAEIVRENGKAVKDPTGKIVKDRKTLRDIRTIMVGEEEPTAPAMPEWTPQESTNRGAGIFVPPMNWTP